MRRRKVAIYSAQNLHAKVFAFDNSVFIGSANVSTHSANVLQEAVVRITDAAVSRAARSFIKDLCLEPLEPEELKRLRKLYRPARFVPGQSKKSDREQRFSVLRIAPTTEVDISVKLERAFDAGRKEATRKRKHNRGFAIEEFYWYGSGTFRKGQLVIQVHKNAHGRAVVHLAM
jgi:phosphatidylserine/phosphatidylglycerophosphate/cardiolipin synthase-like enzyme